jgi:hypothetical protein
MGLNLATVLAPEGITVNVVSWSYKQADGGWLVLRELRHVDTHNRFNQR